MGEQKDIDIILNCDANSEEVMEIKKLSRECGIDQFSVSNSGGKRHIAADFPPELIIAITFAVGGAITGGFFNAVGTDLWNKLKQLMKRSTRYYESQNGGQEIYNADLILDFKEKDVSILQIVLKRSSEQNFEDIVKKLEAELSKSKLGDKFIRFDYDRNGWALSPKAFKNQHEEYSEFMQRDIGRKVSVPVNVESDQGALSPGIEDEFHSGFEEIKKIHAQLSGMFSDSQKIELIKSILDGEKNNDSK